MRYHKFWTAVLSVQKSTQASRWVKWVHNMTGLIHCFECLSLHDCWFLFENAPLWPHHEKCHCTLEAIDYDMVLMSVAANSDYSKFDPYLFNTTGIYFHGKEKLFEQWGYTVDDAKWLQTEMERQAREQYVSGNYRLGRLNMFGQRVDIMIEIPRKDQEGTVTFISGWMVKPNGKLILTTPYGGK